MVSLEWTNSCSSANAIITIKIILLFLKSICPIFHILLSVLFILMLFTSLSRREIDNRSEKNRLNFKSTKNSLPIYHRPNIEKVKLSFS